MEPVVTTESLAFTLTRTSDGYSLLHGTAVVGEDLDHYEVTRQHRPEVELGAVVDELAHLATAWAALGILGFVEMGSRLSHF